MSKLSLRALLGIGGASLACAVPVGLFFGLKQSLFVANSLAPANSINQVESTNNGSVGLPRQIACLNEDGENLELEALNGIQVNEEMLGEITSTLRDSNGKCLKEEDTR